MRELGRRRRVINFWWDLILTFIAAGDSPSVLSLPFYSAVVALVSGNQLFVVKQGELVKVGEGNQIINRGLSPFDRIHMSRRRGRIY